MALQRGLVGATWVHGVERQGSNIEMSAACGAGLTITDHDSSAVWRALPCFADIRD